MSRKGHYLGGHMTVGPNSPSYFTKDSMRLPPDDGKPDRLSSAGTVRHAARNQKSELIKAGDPRLKKRRAGKPTRASGSKK
jgi:hypothetical protein